MLHHSPAENLTIAREERVGTIAGAILVAALAFFAIGIIASGLMLFGIATGLDGLREIGLQVASAALGTTFVALGLAVATFIIGRTVVDWMSR